MPDKTRSPRPLTSSGRFAVAAVGGTFNGLHVGHRDYLAVAFRLAVVVHVFITDDKYAKRRKPYPVDPVRKRARQVADFAAAHAEGADCIPHIISSPHDVDVFCTAEELDLVVVVPEHRRRFEVLNRTRRANGLPEFFLLVKPRTTDSGLDISARRSQPGLS